MTAATKDQCCWACRFWRPRTRPDSYQADPAPIAWCMMKGTFSAGTGSCGSHKPVPVPVSATETEVGNG